MNTPIMNWIESLCAFTEKDRGDGVTRLPFTPQSEQARQYLMQQLQELGLTPKTDRFGTITAHLEGQKPESLMIGSHYDSIPNGGKYDGIAGIVTAMDAVRQLRQSGRTPRCSVDIICTNDEEGIRFSKGFLSAKVICGLQSDEELESIVDVKTGETLSQCIRRSPYWENETITLTGALSQVRRFLEIHIEQGGILDAGGQDIGLVENIAGIRRFYLTVTGKGNHSGSTPMAGRKDALVIASRIISAIPDMTAPYPKAVATVGNILCKPNSINAIPAQVQFSLDVRSGKEGYLKSLSDDICRMARDVTEAAGAELDIRVGTYVKAAPMSQDLLGELEDTAKAMGLRTLRMDSGAGHDAQTIADFVETAMLFLPSAGGISHHPDEYTAPQYLQQAADLLYRYLL